MTDDVDDEAPGWNAITAVFERLYPGQEPRHRAFLSGLFGGSEPLQSISAYRSDRGRPHWHLVTYGFSDLYDKEGDGPESGYGFELTLRLPRDDEEDPPLWAFGFLQNLARYVFRSGNTFEPGQYMTINGPIAVGSDTALVAVFFVEDDEAGTIGTPNGSVAFVCVVGATSDEYDAARRWRTSAIVEMLHAQDPVLITDLERESVMGLPDNQARVEAGLAEEGSSCGIVYLDVVEVAAGGLHATIGAKGAAEVRTILPYRLPFGRSFSLLSQDAVIEFQPGDASCVTRIDHGLSITLDATGVDELLRVLRPKRGEYRLAALPDLRITVRPTEITNPDGTVAEVIG